MEEAIKKTQLYPDLPSTELTEAIAKFHGIEPEMVVVGGGSDEVIYMLGHAYLNAGEEVISADPPFATYGLIPPLMDCALVKVPAKSFTHDLEAMAAAVTEKTKLIFISNPYNPTGTIVRKAELDAFMDAIPDRVIVVLDEAYYEYVDCPEYPNGLDYVLQGRNVCVMRTFSKIHALAGLRVGYGLAPAELMKWLVRVREPFNVCTIAQVAALASLEDTEQVVKSASANREGRKYLCEQFDAMGMGYPETHANFIFADIGIDSKLAFDMLRGRGIAVRTGDIFGSPTHIRVTVGTQAQNEQFIGALKEVCAEAAS